MRPRHGMDGVDPEEDDFDLEEDDDLDQSCIVFPEDVNGNFE